MQLRFAECKKLIIKKLIIKRKRGKNRKKEGFVSHDVQTINRVWRATLIYNNHMDIKIKIEVMSVGRELNCGFWTCESLIKR